MEKEQKSTEVPQEQKAPRNVGRIVKTTLDSLPAGTDESIPDKDSKLVRSPLPEGVNSKMLYSDIIRIAGPSFLELILTQLTSMADQIMVGHLAGTAGVAALSAVGLSAQPKFLLMTMVQSLNIGATAMVARFRGQQNREKANQTFRQSIVLNLVISAIMVILGLTFAAPLLRFMGGAGISDEAFGFAMDYFTIQMYGFIPLCMTFTTTAVLRGIGETRKPLMYNTIANVVNVCFNYILIYGKFGFPELGVAGASLATVIGQTVAFFIALSCVLNKKNFVYLSFKEKFKFDFDILRNVVSIGIPSMIEQLFMRGGNIIFTRAVTSLGDISYATHQICMNIQAMSFMTGNAIANASTTLMGQSLGKKRYDMAEIYVRHTRRVSLVVSVCLGAIICIFGRNIVGLYNDTPEIIALGGGILIALGLIQPIQSNQFVVAGSLRGAGDTKFTAKVTFITVLLVRSGLAVLFINVLHVGLWGAWIALMIDQCLRTCLILYRYNTGKWRFMKLRGQVTEKPVAKEAK